MQTGAKPRRGRVRALLTVTGALMLAVAAPASPTERLPPTFADELVAVIPEPTAIAFTPTGDMLVATRDGRVWLKPPGRPAQRGPVIDVRRAACAELDSGLMGIAVDPLFAWNRFVYLYYTRRRSRDCRTDAVNRVSRFVLTGSARARRRSEHVLLDNMPSPTGLHNAGDLHFGKDGFLYIATGDGGCHPLDAGRCGVRNPVAREPNDLLGKILRIDRDGRAPAENGGDARCALVGRVARGRRCREVFASGLRNPFRMAFDPNTEQTRFFINDVGRTAAEEINLGRLGADYGWPLREGSCPAAGRRNCGNPPSGLTDPIFEYTHRDRGCKAITAGVFVPRGVWPEPYDGAYLFADYICGRIWRLATGRDGRGAAAEFVSGLGERAPVDLAFGPAAGGPALYYASFARASGFHRRGLGEIRVIFRTLGNRRPEARIAARPRSGRLPLDVRLDARSSWDPDAGDRLRYHWVFGDGHGRVTRAPVVTHRYRTRGIFTVGVTVSDGRAVSDQVSLRVFAGHRPPVPRITGPRTYRARQPLVLRGAASDPEDGRVPARRLRWRVELHHERHTHPYTLPVTGTTLRIRGAIPEDRDALRTSFLRVHLTATDRHGLSGEATHDLLPAERPRAATTRSDER